MSIPAFLASLPAFDQLDKEDLTEAANHIEVVHYEAGDYLIRRGEQGTFMLIVRDGQVKVPIIDNLGRERTVVKLGMGDVVGEIALMTGERRRADVIAETAVTALKFEQSVIMPMLAEHPPIGRFLTELLGKRLEEGGGIDTVGKYRLLGKLGEGATAKVYEALHPGLNRTVAVKMLGHHLVHDQEFRERFLQEARVIAGLSHPNIVSVYDTEQAYATWFLVMAKVEGGDLRKRLDEEGPLPIDEVTDILRQMAAALEYAHDRGICHRDVKPENAAIDEDGNVTLMDFGIARRVKSSGGPAKTVEGTPAYLAPEAVTGKLHDHRADVYALGIMAFELLTGRHPLTARNVRELMAAHVRATPMDVRQLRPETPQYLVDFIQGALTKDPERRLTDWRRINDLLNAEDSGSGPLFEECIVRIRYSVRDRARVEKAVGTLKRGLKGLKDGDVATAMLVDHREPEPTLATGESEANETGWFARLRGLGSVGESDNVNSTRIVD